MASHCSGGGRGRGKGKAGKAARFMMPPRPQPKWVRRPGLLRSVWCGRRGPRHTCGEGADSEAWMSHL